MKMGIIIAAKILQNQRVYNVTLRFERLVLSKSERGVGISITITVSHYINQNGLLKIPIKNK